MGSQRQVWFIPIADERAGVQVKLWDPLRTRAIALPMVIHEEARYIIQVAYVPLPALLLEEI